MNDRGKPTMIREVKISDILSIRRMYECLSAESKRFFFNSSKPISLQWLTLQLTVFSSTLKVLRKHLLRVYPYSVFFWFVAVNEQGEVVGFAFLKVEKRLLKGGCLAELGICIRDDYQGRGLGSKLMEYLIADARKRGIKRICLRVSSDNIKAINLFKKYGFNQTRRITKEELQMMLNLS